MEEIEKFASPQDTQSLMEDLRQIINQARGHVAATANYELTMMYWHIGERINRVLVSALTEMYLGASVRSMESRLSRKWRDNCKRSTERKDLMTKVSEE